MLDKNDIERRIPHRPPFLFIDRIVEIGPDRIVAEREVREEEPHFAGHYPGNPILPGVLVCEAAFQAAAVLLVDRLAGGGEVAEGRTPVLSRITDARFRRMIKPGDKLRIVVTHRETLSKFEFLNAVVETDGRKAASLSFALALL